MIRSWIVEMEKFYVSTTDPVCIPIYRCGPNFDNHESTRPPLPAIGYTARPHRY